MSSVSNFELADTLPLLATCLAEISPLPLPSQAISLAVDLEGVDLCRHGRVSIMQIMSNLSAKVWLIDVTVLGRQAFDYTDPDGRSLRGILEGEGIRKASTRDAITTCLRES
jgi:exonuclease 3'-5' domain-containing protein 1